MNRRTTVQRSRADRLAGVLRVAGGSAGPNRAAPPGGQWAVACRLHRARRPLRSGRSPTPCDRAGAETRVGEEPTAPSVDAHVQTRPGPPIQWRGPSRQRHDHLGRPSALQTAIPFHRQHVRHLVLDRISPEQLDQLGAISRTILNGLQQPDGSSRVHHLALDRRSGPAFAPTVQRPIRRFVDNVDTSPTALGPTAFRHPRRAIP